VPASRSSGPTRSSKRRPATGRQRSTQNSVVRCGAALALVLLGIAWLVVYVTSADADSGTPPGWLSWMGHLGRWNYLIGFGLLLLGLATAAHPGTPLGRGRGVVVGMLGCFLAGLVWIVVYYVTGQSFTLPLITDLSQYNLVVGIGFMAVGFVYATHWE
jgi:cell division protein CrgA